MHHIYLCECNSKTFITWTYSNHPWLWPACVKSKFAFTRTVEIKGLCLKLKRSGTEYAAQKINFLTSTVANDCPLPLLKVSLGSNKFLMSYYLFIFSSHQHVQHMTSQILLILIAVLPTFWSETTVSNHYNSGTRKILRNGKRRSSWFLLLLQIRE